MNIAFLNQKGGVGKTTLTVNIAAALALRGARVLVIDADPQASALDWRAAREDEPGFSLVGLPKPTIHKEVEQIGASFDHVLIDGPPRVTDLARSVIMAADIVVIPVQPSPYDVWASDEAVRLCKESLIYRPDLEIVFTINRRIVNTAIGRDVAMALGEFDIPVLENSIAQRVIFAEAAAQGKTVFDLEPQGVAAREIQAVADELVEFA